MSTTKSTDSVVISRPNFVEAHIRIKGITPLVQHKFSKKARDLMLRDQITAGAKSKKKEIRNLMQEMKDGCHVGEDGVYGFPCSAIRSACIRACSAVGFKMTQAKMSIFCLADSIDADDGMPLFHLDVGEPELHEGVVRLSSGVAYVAARPMWREWAATVRLQFDGDQFTLTDVNNLMARAGVQVGIGEGRTFSKSSNGTGWGSFGLVDGDGNVLDFQKAAA